MATTGNLPFIPDRAQKPAFIARTLIFYMLDCVIARRIFGICKIFFDHSREKPASALNSAEQFGFFVRFADFRHNSPVPALSECSMGSAE